MSQIVHSVFCPIFLLKQSEHFFFPSKTISLFIIGIAKEWIYDFYYRSSYSAHGKLSFEKVDLFLLANVLASSSNCESNITPKHRYFRGPVEAFGKSSLVSSLTRPSGGFDKKGNRRGMCFNRRISAERNYSTCRTGIIAEIERCKGL